MTSIASHTFILIGHPVGHSLSPVIHQAAYDALGLVGHRYLCVDCPDRQSVDEQVQALRRGRIQGANVTVPHKRLALSLADRVEGAARDTGAANVLAVEKSARGEPHLVIAHNTDVGGLADELSAGHPSARAAAVIGSGGAALAAVAACRSIGVENVAVTARRWSAAQPSEGWPRADELRALGAATLAWPEDAGSRRAWHDAVEAADLIIQATSAGMKGADSGESVSEIVPWASLVAGAFAYDVVYTPASTPFLDAARQHGVQARGGLGMLVGQAARALELWLEVEAPRAAMQAAAQRALAAEGAE